MLNRAVLGFLCCTGCLWALASPEMLWQELEKEQSRRCPWDCLAFVQMWPGSFCVGRQILVQIKVSLYSSFASGCVPDPSKDISPYKPCTAEKRVFYFPPNLKNPYHPCP